MIAIQYMERILYGMNNREKALETALLWVIYEQCVYGGKAYAKLLIHGKEAFESLNLSDGCDVSEIEKRLFNSNDPDPGRQ